MDAFNREHTIYDVKNEINIIGKCYHPNVLQYYTSFTEGKELWIVMPLMSAGSLGRIIRSKSKLGLKDEVLVASILLQIIEGL
jgi:serine/threonine-protein kinase OSR1/STK39